MLDSQWEKQTLHLKWIHMFLGQNWDLNQTQYSSDMYNENDRHVD